MQGTIWILELKLFQIETVVTT